MTITIEDFDWSALDGRTVNLTVQIKGDHVYVIEGQVVRVVDLGAGRVQDELPFFGPRSTRTGRLSEEQQKALDRLIAEGYTAHRAAMLLGVHDSTVAHRKQQLRGGTPARRGHTAALTEAEIETIRLMWFEQGKTKVAIATALGRSDSVVGHYVAEMERGLHGGHPLALSNGHLIEHEEVPS